MALSQKFYIGIQFSFYEAILILFSFSVNQSKSPYELKCSLAGEHCLRLRIYVTHSFYLTFSNPVSHDN